MGDAGCGLPPGPSGLLGAAEGVSYLSVVGIAAWGLASKLSSGKGLPAGTPSPFAHPTSLFRLLQPANFSM